jgi:hypothetical protein
MRTATATDTTTTTINIPDEYQPNYTPDDLDSSITTNEQLVDEVNRLRREVNQLLKVTGLTSARLADWVEQNVGTGAGRNYTVEG